MIYHHDYVSWIYLKEKNFSGRSLTSWICHFWALEIQACTNKCVCGQCVCSPGKDMKTSCQWDVSSLAVGLSSWLADISQRPLKAFAEPYQVVFISWSRRDEPGESVCPADAAASPRPVQTLSRSGSSVASIDRPPVLAAQPWLLRLRLLSLNHIVFIWSSLLHSLQSGTYKVK